MRHSQRLLFAIAVIIKGIVAPNRNLRLYVLGTVMYILVGWSRVHCGIHVVEHKDVSFFVPCSLVRSTRKQYCSSDMGVPVAASAFADLSLEKAASPLMLWREITATTHGMMSSTFMLFWRTQ
jgi:hypothetical protein